MYYPRDYEMLTNGNQSTVWWPIKSREIRSFFALWTDARRPVPRLWIRSAEVQGGTSLGEWEHNNNFLRWPVTRCFIKRDRAGLIIIDHSLNFRLNGEHWRAVQSRDGDVDCPPWWRLKVKQYCFIYNLWISLATGLPPVTMQCWSQESITIQR